jgi:hypothetical protein
MAQDVHAAIRISAIYRDYFSATLLQGFNRGIRRHDELAAVVLAARTRHVEAGHAKWCQRILQLRHQRVAAGVTDKKIPVAQHGLVAVKNEFTP